MRHLTVGLALLSLIACGRAPEQSSSGGPGTDVDASLHGMLIWGHEARSFSACGSTEEDWVVDATGGAVRSAYEALATEPYEPIFFEVRGTFGPTPEAGFAAEYARSLAISEVVHARRGVCDEVSQGSISNPS